MIKNLLKLSVITLLYFLISVSQLLAEQNIKFGIIELNFQDSITGASIKPDSLLINGEEMKSKVDNYGKLILLLKEGEYLIEVYADGYEYISTVEKIDGTENLPNSILLDPKTPPKEISSIVRKLRNPKSAIIAGYIVDNETGYFIEGAEVALLGRNLKTKTNKDGFFILSVPVIKIDPEFLPKGDLIISKKGYKTQERREIALFQGADKLYSIRLERGNDYIIINEQEERGNIASWLFDEKLVTAKPEDLLPIEDILEFNSEKPNFTVASPRPTSIRVGFTSTGGQCCTSCSKVSTMDIETYVKRVLPAEWIASWRADSLRAGAVAIRSYGGWHVYNPKSSKYDICSSACCQVYGSSTYSSTNSATDYTKGMYLLDKNNNIVRSEYSAENNNTGCGDCYTGTCLYDQVCCGASPNGHGRGMCQWGSQRWATKAKTYKWILDHYYSQYNWHLGY